MRSAHETRRAFAARPRGGERFRRAARNSGWILTDHQIQKCAPYRLDTSRTIGGADSARNLGTLPRLDRTNDCTQFKYTLVHSRAMCRHDSSTLVTTGHQRTMYRIGCAQTTQREWSGGTRHGCKSVPILLPLQSHSTRWSYKQAVTQKRVDCKNN